MERDNPPPSRERAREARCQCPECRALDRAHPSEGVQLALFPPAPKRNPFK